MWVPAKPAWYSRIGQVIRELEGQPRTYVERAAVEFLLGVGRRRAQQIMAPCITDRVGTNGLADRDLLIAHLRRLGEGEDGYYERRRRHKVGRALEEFERERSAQPRLLVEAPVEVISQEFADLPEGVRLEPGRITVAFNAPREALEKLLALAMAVSNDFEGFERRVGSSRVEGGGV